MSHFGSGGAFLRSRRNSEPPMTMTDTQAPPIGETPPVEDSQETQAPADLDAALDAVRTRIETPVDDAGLNAPTTPLTEGETPPSEHAAPPTPGDSVNSDELPETEQGDQPTDEGEPSSRRAKAENQRIEAEVERRLAERTASAESEAQRLRDEADQREQELEAGRQRSREQLGDPAEVQRLILANARGELTYEEQQDLATKLERRQFFDSMVNDSRMAALQAMSADFASAAGALPGIDSAALGKAGSVADIVKVLHAAGSASQQAEIASRDAVIAERDAEIVRLNGELADTRVGAAATSRRPELGGSSVSGPPLSGLKSLLGPDGLPSDEAEKLVKDGKLRGFQFQS